jgi:hypothetical protein
LTLLLLDDLTVQNVAVLLTLQGFVSAFSFLLLALDFQAMGLHSSSLASFHVHLLLLHVVLSHLGGEDVLVVLFQIQLLHALLLH